MTTDTLYDEKYMRLAFKVSKSATCDRRHVGCVIVKDDELIGIGCNTSPTGSKTCDEVGHLMKDGSCKRTVHAEVNACLDSHKSGHTLTNARVYTTDQPCSDCLKFLTNLGVSHIFYVREYPPKYEVDTGVQLIKVDCSIDHVEVYRN